MKMTLSSWSCHLQFSIPGIYWCVPSHPAKLNYIPHFLKSRVLVVERASLYSSGWSWTQNPPASASCCWGYGCAMPCPVGIRLLKDSPHRVCLLSVSSVRGGRTILPGAGLSVQFVGERWQDSEGAPAGRLTYSSSRSRLCFQGRMRRAWPFFWLHLSVHFTV